MVSKAVSPASALAYFSKLTKQASLSKALLMDFEVLKTYTLLGLFVS